MDDGVLRAGGVVHGTDDLTDVRRYRDIPRWSCLFVGGSEYAVFACRPGAEAAFAAMTHGGGAVKEALRLPAVSGVLPWGLEIVRLRLPQVPHEPLGELMVTVLNAEGCAPDSHPGLSLSSPIGRLPLLHNFGEAFGNEDLENRGPVRHPLPAGSYRVEIDQWFGLTCGNLPPSLDRHVRADLITAVKPGVLTQETLERPRGTHLDLDLTLVGDGGEFLAARDEFLEEWELLTFEEDPVPGHRWRAEAWLQPIDTRGNPDGPAFRYACGWEGCWHKVDRYQFPVSGLIGGLRQYPPGRYRLTVSGPGIDTITQELQIPNLDGGTLVLCLATRSLPAKVRIRHPAEE